ncbi:MAG: pyridoxal phosphate-dependent aminotransferase [Pseudomonadota bacterium]
MHVTAALSRLGTETAFDVLARAGTLAAAGHDVINLGIGQPDFPTPPHIVEAGIAALREGHHGYTPANGIPALREAVVADIARHRGVAVAPERIVIQPGGKPTMFFAILMFGEPGAQILYPDPGFPIYRSMIEFTGATPVPVALPEARGFSFDPDAVLAQITPATRLLILNSPGNPTGGVAPRAAVERLVAGLAAHPQVAILSDEIYSRMHYDGAEPVSLLQYPEISDRLILLDGWSKTYAMTGWRMGYGLWPEALVERATRLCVNAHSCVNAATQQAGIAALNGPQDAVAEMMAAFTARRDFLVPALNDVPGVRCAMPGGAFYAFPNVEGTGIPASVLQDRLLQEAHVATIAGPSFGVLAPNNLRLSFANSLENIERAVERLAGWLRHNT